MTEPVPPAYDDWRDAEPTQAERTEPHCLTCGDDRTVPSWRGRRQCPDCHPTGLDLIRHRIHTRTWQVRMWVRRQLPGYTDELPF
jgi:hypothetical protein